MLSHSLLLVESYALSTANVHTVPSRIILSIATRFLNSLDIRQNMTLLSDRIKHFQAICHNFCLHPFRLNNQEPQHQGQDLFFRYSETTTHLVVSFCLKPWFGGKKTKGMFAPEVTVVRSKQPKPCVFLYHGTHGRNEDSLPTFGGVRAMSCDVLVWFACGGLDFVTEPQEGYLP